MIRRAAARRFLAACLLVLATASPALAGGRDASAPKAGLVDRLAAWVSSLWTAAGDILDGGCILDPNGGCRDGAGAPPPAEIVLPSSGAERE